MQTLEDIIVRFDIDSAHSLKQQNSEQREQNQTHYTTCWYVEKDDQQRIVARYRSWCNQATLPPYRTQLGWERYSPAGTLLEREVRYTKLDHNRTIH